MFKENQIWISKEYPERSVIINGIWNNSETNKNDNTMMCSWITCNDEAWNEFVCKKLKVNSIQELLDNGGNTYPYAYSDCRSFKSMKNYIKKYNMKLKEGE